MTPSLPSPPDIRRQQEGSASPESMMSRVGKTQNDSQAATTRGMQEMMEEIKKIADSTLKVAQMADKSLPSIMGDVAKLIEIGKSMQQGVMQAMQQMQQGSSAAPAQQPAQSPTDAPPAEAV